MPKMTLVKETGCPECKTLGEHLPKPYRGGQMRQCKKCKWEFMVCPYCKQTLPKTADYCPTCDQEIA